MKSLAPKKKKNAEITYINYGKHKGIAVMEQKETEHIKELYERIIHLQKEEIMYLRSLLEKTTKSP